MSKNNTVMKAKMWMLSGFAVLVLSLVTCHKAFGYDDTGISPYQIQLRQSYIDSHNRYLEDKEQDELLEEAAYKLRSLSQCAVYRMLQGQRADNVRLRDHRMKQGVKLLDHFLLYSMALEDVVGIENFDADMMVEGLEGNSKTIGASMATLFEPDIDPETLRNVDAVCMDADSLAEGREWNIRKNEG